MAIKLDFQKAYDRMNWSFLKEVLLRFGFNETFTSWIMACVTTVSFEVLINGGKYNQFKPSRGVRRGDTMSPYLFILAQEFLSRLLDQEFHFKKISGVKANLNEPAITHVMYADDIVLFSKATRMEAMAINECLDIYYKWSGQCINRSKSGMYFSKHTPRQTTRGIKQIFRMKGLKKDFIYLGAPMFLSRSPSKDFRFLQNKLEARLSGWRSRTLSWADMSALISTVAQNLPNYTMSSFKVPSCIYDKLDGLTRCFWWKPNNEDGKFLALKSWDKLCYPKAKGGLGFKKAAVFNNALLAKLAWLIASKRDSLCMLLLRAKYKVRQGWLYANRPKICSPLWKAIEGTKSIIVKGTCYQLGDASSINVWTDPWVPWLQNFKPKLRLDSIAETH